jgi:hypothetical protein
MRPELITLIARVRRAMPRNADVMKLCEELERSMAPGAMALRDAVASTSVASTPQVVLVPQPCPACDARREAKTAAQHRWRERSARRPGTK